MICSMRINLYIGVLYIKTEHNMECTMVQNLLRNIGKALGSQLKVAMKRRKQDYKNHEYTEKENMIVKIFKCCRKPM